MDARHNQTDDPRRGRRPGRAPAQSAPARRSGELGPLRGGARLVLGLRRRRRRHRAARRPHRGGHRGTGEADRPDAGRVPERDLRQRRRADHRVRRAARGAHRARAGHDHGQHHRQPAARLRAGGVRGRPRPGVAAVRPEGGGQRHDHAVPGRRRAGDAGRLRPDGLRQPGTPPAGHLLPERGDIDPPHRGLREQPRLRLHYAARPAAGSGVDRGAALVGDAVGRRTHRGHRADRDRRRGPHRRPRADARLVRMERAVHRRHRAGHHRQRGRALQRGRRPRGGTR